MKKVLCLGAGLVARPFIHYLSEHGFHVVVASRTKSKAENLIEGCENAEAVAFNIASDDSLLEELTAKVDLVCSLLPYTFHVKAAKVDSVSICMERVSRYPSRVPSASSCSG